MKKGLRPLRPSLLRRGVFSDHRPDEEGIKTMATGTPSTRDWVSDHRPDEEGIKTTVERVMTAARELSDHRPDEEGIKTLSEGPLHAMHSFRPQT